MQRETLGVPQYPRVILVEDDGMALMWAKDSLSMAGSEVILERETLDEVLAWASKNPGKRADVIVLGGQFPSGLKVNEVREAERAIRKAFSGVRIVAFSFDRPPIGDERVSKADFYQRKIDLGSVVREISRN